MLVMGMQLLKFSYLMHTHSFLQMHANDFRNDHHGVVSGLRDGGYSDDMTLAAIAGILFFLCYLFNLCVSD